MSDDSNDLIFDEPLINNIIGDSKKKIQAAISFLFSLKIKIEGLKKKEIHRVLNAYIPIKEVI